jgi:SPP1 gp7 family putative phage head morphogenesis protein
VNEQQIRQVVRNQFRLLDLSKVVMQRSDDALTQAIIEAARLIKSLPPAGDLLREQAWKAMMPRLDQLFTRAVGGMAQELVPVLREEVLAQVNFAAAYIKPGQHKVQLQWSEKSSLAGQSLAGQAAGAPLSSPGFGLGASGATPPWAVESSARAIGAAAVAEADKVFTVKVPPNVYGVVKRTSIAGGDLARTFGVSVDASGQVLALGTERSGLARFLVKSIDHRVRQGFLAGEATEAIAQNLVIDSVRSGVNLGPTALKLKQDATAVARTGLLDLANRVHEEVWDANSDAIVAYVFDASNDSRACPTCVALDGKEGSKDAIPRPPIHPQCRCQKLPVTRVELELRKSGEGLRDTPGSAVELVAPKDMPKRLPGETQKDWLRRLNQDAKKAGGTVRWYQSTKSVNGQTFYQRARDLQQPGTVAHWLADPKTSRAALEQAMGGGNAGSLRADWFLRQVNQKGMDPQKAYVELLKFRGMTNRSVSPDRLARFKATAELPGINSITPRAPRRPISRTARPPR